ncbi:unnamed protein product [Trichobilharzia regenti]|nr:unnamed protein product [Trichobilharzia regenti]
MLMVIVLWIYCVVIDYHRSRLTVIRKSLVIQCTHLMQMIIYDLKNKVRLILYAHIYPYRFTYLTLTSVSHICLYFSLSTPI